MYISKQVPGMDILKISPSQKSLEKNMMPLFSDSRELLLDSSRSCTSLNGSLAYQAFLDELVAAVTPESDNFVVFSYQAVDT